DQERPNIFTQAVANIMPGEKVGIVISYVETLRYDEGICEFVFPMVVGPRYIPGNPAGRQAGGWAPDTDRVPDASRITPPVAVNLQTMQPTRAGHDISLEAILGAGLPAIDLRSVLHEIETRPLEGHGTLVRLTNRAEIPNRDFILRYRVAGAKIQDAVFAHKADREGFFMLVIQPPERFTSRQVTAKELVFVIDTSGSMSGFPIEKAKETVRLALEGLYAGDTFNLITFAGDTHVLFPEPVAAIRENIEAAQRFLASRQGGGGTEMMKAIVTALEPSDRQDHIRIVCFMTDGFVGNDMEIIGEVRKHSNARVFAFGIGNSVNRFLLDQMALHGRGEVEYVTLSDDGSSAARRFHERVRDPLLTDIRVDWGGLSVHEVQPARIPDLFGARPVVITGRYSRPGSGIFRLTGKQAGGHFAREVPVFLPEREERHDVIATLWARERVADLMAQDYLGIQRNAPRQDIRDQITQLGLDYRLMTQYTSFVAVEELTITDGGQPRRIEVPVEMPQGVDPRGVFGEPKSAPPQMLMLAPGVVGGAARGMPQTAAATVSVESAERTVARDAATRRPINGREQQLPSKLHPEIAQALELRKKAPAGAATVQARFIRNGKAEVQVWLSRSSDDLVARLKKMGVEILGETAAARLLICRIPLDRLEAVLELDEVRYVAPL
ncbi:MAG: VWA domain-containing protein, partial [Acidobacteriota bacterium]